MNSKDIKTYVSLFSSAGIGCYGFKMENFECIATNELIERRLNVQKANKKCKYDTGYICGDITSEQVKNNLFAEIDKWKANEKIEDVDVVIATPPCQGMSVANLKKKNEINRNSLVIESIKIILNIKPKFFVLENVASFLRTACIDVDEKVKSIEEAIYSNLGDDYIVMSKIINFKDYGGNSSRTRTIVIGVRNNLGEYISPIDLFPKHKKEHTLRQIIGNIKSLKCMGEIDKNDIYHFFRTYPDYMRDWIKDLKEGESAFDNDEETKRPHRIVNGKIIMNVNKTGDKYKRQYWDKVAPCIHTRNDQLASQNTIHPSDDRVFSIRELMKIMTIPNTFKWVDADEKDLNKLSVDEKIKFLKKEEINIRQSIGEAVPTEIFRQIALNINKTLDLNNYTLKEINRIILEENLLDNGNLDAYIKRNKTNLSFATLSKIAELSNAKRNNEEAFYTNKSLLNDIYKNFPTINKSEINILEPSVGVGNFIPFIISKYANVEKLNIDVIDINPNSLSILKQLIKTIDIPDNVFIKYINDDFLTYKCNKKYDLVVGNPPFKKLTQRNCPLNEYKKECINDESKNSSSYFLEKATMIADNVVMVMPKFLLNTSEYEKTRDYLSKFSVNSIIDFGEKGFEGVLIETICIAINVKEKPNYTFVKSVPKQLELKQKQNYIMDKELPYWIIYRNEEFDAVYSKLEFNIFDVFRDRQITNSNTSKQKKDVWVVKSRNISDDGLKIEHIENYDSYIKKEDLSSKYVYNFYNKNVYVTPNMTYNPRVAVLPNGCTVNGSLAILLPKNNFKLSKKDMLYFSSLEYRNFYRIARNYQTRSLNIDKSSVFFFGKVKK